MNIVYAYMSGAVMMGLLVAGLFFFRFWKQSRDRLFFIFGLAFWIMAIERVAILLLGIGEPEQNNPLVYLLRLGAFLIIIGAIADKNRRR
jgi:hypothetical protein